MGELHCTNMIFRRQLITAAAAIITLTVLLASTDAAHIEDTVVVPESTDSVRLVETGGGYDFSVKVCAQHGLTIKTGGTCHWFGCHKSRNSASCNGQHECNCVTDIIPGTNNACVLMGSASASSTRFYQTALGVI